MVLKIHGYVAIYSKSFYQFKLKQTMTNSVELEKKKSSELEKKHLHIKQSIVYTKYCIYN